MTCCGFPVAWSDIQAARSGFLMCFCHFLVTWNDFLMAWNDFLMTRNDFHVAWNDFLVTWNDFHVAWNDFLVTENDSVPTFSDSVQRFRVLILLKYSSHSFKYYFLAFYARLPGYLSMAMAQAERMRGGG